MWAERNLLVSWKSVEERPPLDSGLPIKWIMNQNPSNKLNPGNHYLQLNCNKSLSVKAQSWFTFWVKEGTRRTCFSAGLGGRARRRGMKGMRLHLYNRRNRLRAWKWNPSVKSRLMNFTQNKRMERGVDARMGDVWSPNSNLITWPTPSSGNCHQSFQVPQPQLHSPLPEIRIRISRGDMRCGPAEQRRGERGQSQTGHLNIWLINNPCFCKWKTLHMSSMSMSP